ncbi:hypothetical protein U9M48_005254 [Paspalum notatum var. saurae]|uniref:Uncharacterized protein n=1 Tax=Paspalum notatum var. saurae TaxID=547442 RepID=A0AAQ3SJR1_PASNO
MHSVVNKLLPPRSLLFYSCSCVTEYVRARGSGRVAAYSVASSWGEAMAILHHHGGERQANPSVDQAQHPGGRERDAAGNHSGSHYDDRRHDGGCYEVCCNGGANHHEGGADYFGGDCGCVDQSQPAEEAAALLRKEFEALGIHVRGAEPVFHPRPGYGEEGKPCVVRTNRFLVRLIDEGVHQYDVTISPEPTRKSVCSEVMSKMVSENLYNKLCFRFPAYDGRDSLFTAGTLPLHTMEFDVTLSTGDDERTPSKYKVVIKHATAISLLQLRMLLAGYPTNIPAQARQVLDIMLREVILKERDDMDHVQQNTYIGCLDGRIGQQDLVSLPVLMKFCIFSIPDVSSPVFIQPLLLTEFVQKILNIDILDRKLTKPEHSKLLKALRGVRIEVTHQGDKRHKYRIAGLSVKPATDLSFQTLSGAMKTVTDYFRERYNLELKCKFLPCLNVGSEQNPTYLPIEVCKIVPRQRYQTKLEGSQVFTPRRTFIRFNPEPERSIRQDNSTKRAREFVQAYDYVTTVDARVLLPPTLKYHNSGSHKTLLPMDGRWNMKDKKVVNGAKISNWACVNFCGDLSKNAVEQFCFSLAEMSRVTGVNSAVLKLPIFAARPDHVEDDIRICYQEAQNELRFQKNDLLLAILPDENGALYGNVKRICETDIGLMSQCCRRSNVFTKNNQILANIAIKINAKVVASQDWHDVAKYNSVVRAQGYRQELINGLEDIVRELLHAFEKESNKKAQQLIFYRDGISEGQFKQVLDKEIPEIEKAWKALYDKENPQITFIVVQKRHGLKLFPSAKKYQRYAKRINIEPGTVVDHEICHPAEFGFFLCSHAVIKGPSRPVQYLVLRDDNNNLCYTNASGTQSVSIASPLYYANKLAQRARVYLARGSDTATSVSSSGAAVPAGGLKQLPEIKDELKRSMFYC